MSIRKIPQRTCIGCNKTTSKRELLRIVRTPEGDVEIDLTSKRSGRGAYICSSVECLNKAIKGNKLEKTLEIEIPEEVIKRLSIQISGDDE